MSFRERTALRVAPIFIRLVLAATFLWAGLGKILTTFDVSGDTAAKLANMGVNIGAGPTPAGAPPTAPPVQPPSGKSGPDAKSPPTRGDHKGEPDASGGISAPALLTPGNDPFPADQFSGKNGQGAGAPTAAKTYTAADFPEPRPVTSMYRLSLLIDHAANPGADKDGKAPMALWPVRLSQGSWPYWLAWAVVVTEIGGGVMVLVGMFTRLWALALAGTMMGAAWLTQIGPAVAAGNAKLGFLPAQDWFPIDAWSGLLWQFALLGAALSLLFSGSGAVAVDNALFGRSGAEDDDDKS